MGRPGHAPSAFPCAACHRQGSGCPASSPHCERVCRRSRGLRLASSGWGEAAAANSRRSSRHAKSDRGLGHTLGGSELLVPIARLPFARGLCQPSRIVGPGASPSAHTPNHSPQPDIASTRGRSPAITCPEDGAGRPGQLPDAGISRRIQSWRQQRASAGLASTSQQGLREYRRFSVRAPAQSRSPQPPLARTRRATSRCSAR